MVHSLPHIDGRNLLGEKRRIPADLPADRTFVIAAFLQHQQGAVDRWISALSERGVADSPLDPTFTGKNIVLEFPVLGSKWSFVQRRIDGGMAAHIKIPRVLARTWTFYTTSISSAALRGLPRRIRFLPWRSINRGRSCRWLLGKSTTKEFLN